jgi:glycosyltransferase involved in cell wall biosynthesis
MNYEPTVSVLLPVHDGVGTIQDAVASILAQSLGDFELLVLDDGSKDGTDVVVRRFGDDRIRWISDGRHLGLANRLNQGIELAAGRYIARMDADDICAPERLERQVAYMESHPSVDLLGCRAVVFNEEGAVLGLLPFAATHATICARPWLGFPMPHPTWLGKNEWFRKFRYAFPEVRRAEDQELLLRSHELSCFACLNEVLVAYRQGEYDFRRRILARRSLFMAQAYRFMRLRQWRYATLATLVMAVRLASDLTCQFAGGQGICLVRLESAKILPGDAAAWLTKWGIGDRCE